MSRYLSLALEAAPPAPTAPTVGCATCWAAKYCASFSALASPQPPPNCPLVPKPKRPRQQVAPY